MTGLASFLRNIGRRGSTGPGILAALGCVIDLAGATPAFAEGFWALTSTLAPAPVFQTVVQVPSTTLVEGSPNPSIIGQGLTLVATLTPPCPGGTVTFKDGAATLDTRPVSAGVATYVTGSLGLGAHSITGEYSGDTNCLGSVSVPLLQQVNKWPTSTTVTSSFNPSTVGLAVKLTAIVSPGAERGTVMFKDGDIVLGTRDFSSSGTSLETSALGFGDHLITALYSGDANYGASTSSSLVQVVGICPLGGANDSDQDSIPDAVESAEGTNTCLKDNDIFTSARLFAMQQYRDFLGREGEADGISFWVSSIEGGTTRAEVTRSFFASPEFQGTIAPVTRLYSAYFRRIPDKRGLDYWIAQYRSGLPLNDISQAFASSSEFVGTYGSLDDTTFVTLVYINVMSRPPDALGLQYWKAMLDGGMTRGEVMLGFSESLEYQQRSYDRVFVIMTYYGMLRRMPEQFGLDYWLGQLFGGASGLDLINAFLAAPEYRARFLP